MKRGRVAQMVEHRGNDPEDGRSKRPPPLRFIPRHRINKHFTVKWGERLGRPECPYLRRWVLALGLFSVRVHHFIRSDDARHLHDHPWAFVTLVLKGGYTDVSHLEPIDEFGKILVREYDHLSVGSIRYRPALHRHTVQVDPGGVWTLILTGPNLRKWGFWVNGKFVRSNLYFFKHGHHPCDQP